MASSQAPNRASSRRRGRASQALTKASCATSSASPGPTTRARYDRTRASCIRTSSSKALASPLAARAASWASPSLPADIVARIDELCPGQLSMPPEQHRTDQQRKQRSAEQDALRRPVTDRDQGEADEPERERDQNHPAAVVVAGAARTAGVAHP